MLRPGVAAPTVFLDITALVLSGGEQGLLGLAFHPEYARNRRFFVNYTRQPDGATAIAEYRASVANPDVAEPVGRVRLAITQPFSNHNGGMIEFGPDGLLYIGCGDGGSGNDPGNRAQNPGLLLGKILRISVNAGDKSVPGPMTPLPDSLGSQPEVARLNWRPEIFAMGFRNPWRFSFDRATGELYVGDVGQSAWEEIDLVVFGGNYGWRVFEGFHCTGLDPALCNAAGFIPPIAEYSHANGRCAVTGGYVYRGSQAALPLGGYVYGDFCTGEIFLLRNGVQTLLLDAALRISSFGEDEAGELYVVDLNGTVHRIVQAGAPQGESAGAASDAANGGPRPLAR